jgi:positive regulator of sigma E activity
MIRIDLRYVAPIVAFYLPPFMFMTLGWMVGYSISDMRETLMIVGAVLGSVSAMITVLFYSTEVSGPQWLYIRGGENK